MKRKAVLIESSNVQGQSDLPGARLDIQNWENYLKSELGGAWQTSEIVILRKPSASKVILEVLVPSDSYCLVAFSGHGSEGSVVLNDTMPEFSIDKFKPGSSKGTVIVDSCRGLTEAVAQTSLIKAAMNESTDRMVLANSLRGKEVQFSRLEAYSSQVSNHRQRYDDALTSSRTGTLSMLACSRGQAAQENPKAGGFYTSLLLNGADKWGQSTSWTSTYTTKEAHEYAKRNLSAQQVPEYTPSSLEFPFGVKIV